jgi:hypothetical protein
MLRIIVNINRQDIVQTYTAGQSWPTLNGKLVSVEASGKELQRLQEVQEIPINAIDSASITWRGRHAGHILRTFKEIFDK